MTKLHRSIVVLSMKIVLIACLFIASTNGCYMQDCATRYNWGPRSKKNDESLYSPESKPPSIFINLDEEYQQCFNGVDVSREFCRLIDSKTCCRITRNQERVCAEATFSRGLVCKPVKRKLADVLERFMNENGLAVDDVSCCINAVNCCGIGKCDAQLSCYLSEEKGHNYVTDDVSRKQNLVSLLLKSIKSQESQNR